MEHKLYERYDKDAPDAIKDRNGEVCLAMCRICGKAENELTEDNCVSLPTCIGDYKAGLARFCDECSFARKCKSISAQIQHQELSEFPFKPLRDKSAADILEDMAKTFRERNAVYGDNYKMVAKLVAVLFPKGVPPELVITDQWHLFELKLVKLSRFAISNLTHQDSIHDDGVYSAMIEAAIQNGKKK